MSTARPRPLRRILTPLLLGGALALAGCGSPQMTDPGRLEDVLRAFNQNQRWSNWGSASQYVSPALAPAWVAARARQNQVQISELSVVQVVPGADPAREADAVVRVEYYVLPAMRLETSAWRQGWRKESDGVWRLVTETRIETAAAPAPNEAPSWP